jgi:hypothetical protein
MRRYERASMVRCAQTVRAVCSLRSAYSLSDWNDATLCKTFTIHCSYG